MDTLLYNIKEKLQNTKIPPKNIDTFIKECMNNENIILPVSFQHITKENINK